MQKGVTDKYASGSLILKQKPETGAIVVGDCNSAVDKHILKPHKIATIFTFGNDALPEKKQQKIIYKQYNVSDNKSQNIVDILDEVYLEIEAARKEGGVLLHCYTGISRSPSFAIAYLMRKKQISYDNAKTFLKKHRNVIQPNDNFHRQLQKYEKILIKRAEEERLRRLKQEQKINNQSAMLSNFSSISKRSGVKGVVRSAHRSISPRNKSIEIDKKDEEYEQVIELKRVGEKQQERVNRSIEKEKKKKQVKSIYENKTKVI